MKIDLHPYKTIKFLRSRIDTLNLELVDMFRENRAYKSDLGKTKEVALAQGRERYWYDRWRTLYLILNETVKGRDILKSNGRGLCPRKVGKVGAKTL